MSDRTATPTVASVLLLDDDLLAARARTTLASADVATVVGSVPHVVTLRDRDGEPEVLTMPEAVREQIGRGRRTTLVITPRLDDGVWLVLDGRLAEREGAVVLAVEAVWVGCPHGHGHARPLDLVAYATAVPDTLRAAMPRLVAHTNAEHAPELRDLAARRFAVSAGEVAAASLADLDASGVTLQAVTLDGGIAVRLPFARPAVAPCELTGLLRGVLTAV